MSKWTKMWAFASLFLTVIVTGIAIYASITSSRIDELDAWLTSAMLVGINMTQIDYWKSFFKKS